MPNRALLPITEIDFEGIKTNLKNYLSTTTEFSDYDYEGAGINILLDLLAYNTHYTAMYANMLAAESFIDSAMLRKSVVSLAKNLGYIPFSSTSARAVVSLEFGLTAGVPSVLPKGTVFTATKDDVDYSFTTIATHDIDKTTVPYKCENIEIYQGIYTTSSFIYDEQSNSTKFEIPFENIDASTLSIYVLRSASDLSNADITWKKNTDFLSIDSTSKVYFLTENHRGRYQLTFGDGILGAKPERGSYIVAVYLRTDGLAANGIGTTTTGQSQFSFSGIDGNNYNATVTTVTASYGGDNQESVEQIRRTAPRYYQSQDRAVTVQDYESIILREFDSARQVRVWGGDENDPPEYGKVFISVLPKGSFYLSDAQKQSLMRNIIDKKKIVSVTSEIVDPDYTYILVECFATYDSSKSLTLERAIKDSLTIAIERYSFESLLTFGKSFRYSTLSRFLDLSSNSMVSNRISTKLAKKVLIQYGKTNYAMDFGNKLYHPQDGAAPIARTSIFKHRDNFNNIRDCILEDDGYGNIALYALFGRSKEVRVLLNAKVGKIDYETGKVNLVGFAPTGSGTLPYIQFTVVPDQRYDIVPKRNQVLVIDSSLENGIVITLNDAAVRKI